VFTKIIQGEAPAYRVYEDERTLAILDIAPGSVGHVLVLTKTAAEKFYALEEADYTALWRTVKKVAAAMERSFGARVIMRASGNRVPHVHIHLTPRDETWFYGRVVEMSAEEMEAAGAKIRAALK
jgi:histidine triad (HIT) family protein